MSCDRQTTLFINNEGVVKTAHNDCGDIDVQARLFGNRLTVIYNFKNGVYHLDPDLVAIKNPDSSNEIEKILFRNFGYNEIKVLKLDTIVSPRKIYATIYLKNLPRIINPPFTFYIVPTNYLKCNDKMAIKDTLYLHYR